MRHTKLMIAMAICASAAACGGASSTRTPPPSDASPGPTPPPAATPPPPPAPGSFPAGATPADQAFRSIAREAIADLLRRHPSAATDLGVHAYDRNLEDLSKAAIAEESKALASFR